MKLCLARASAAVMAWVSLGTFASADDIQRYCSNAEGTLRYFQSNDLNTLVVTHEQVTDEFKVRYEEEVDASGLIGIEAYVQELASENSNDCKESGTTGTATSHTTRVSIISFKKTGDEPFEEDVIGVNEHGSVEAYVICEERRTSEVVCL